MSFSKKQHLQQNINVLQTVFNLENEKRLATAEERILLMQYSGFGGLKFILNPVAKETDINHWRKSEHDLFPLTQQLHQLLRENAIDEKQYLKYVNSMKSSVLTAFYTPPQVIDAISEVLTETGIEIQKFLEPSAGIGSFIDSFSKNQDPKITAYDKDILTGKILNHLYPQSNINIKGFEEVPKSELNTYDVIASNVPFGDTSVFDLSYSRSKDTAKIQAARSIHNYFFLKGTDMLREGGLLIYITSQGIMNSPKNEPIRRALMQGNNLVSAIRLPNNLFTESAGTEVGSDLIILQKNTTKKFLSKEEELFCISRETQYNTPGNSYFQDFSRIIHTDQKLGTDLYGQPALIYNHSEGVSGISSDLKTMLSQDLVKKLNLELYNNDPKLVKAIDHNATAVIIEPLIVQPQVISLIESQKSEQKYSEQLQLSIFDLFENEITKQNNNSLSNQFKTNTKKTKSLKKRSQNNHQIALFSNPLPNLDKAPISYTSSSNALSNLETKRQPIKNTANDILEPMPYSGKLGKFHRNDCLAVNNDWVGHLQNVDTEKDSALFHPLHLPTLQKNRATAYIQLRDTYNELYTKETTLQTEHKEERLRLNALYDALLKNSDI